MLYSDMTGPTSFAPIIETAIGIVDASCGRYHVLMIIADGQVGHMSSISFNCSRSVLRFYFN